MVCFFHLPFYAQIRKYIGIVRPEYNSETVSFLKAFQNELKAKGYNAYANYIDGYLKGRFGSGFVYVNSEGKNFVITNQHVIDYGKLATQEENDIKLDKALKSTEADYSEIAKFISIEKVYESGSLAFIDVLKFAPSKVRDGAVNAYANSPIDGMKYAIAYDLKNNIKLKDEKSKDNTSKKNSEIIKFIGIESPSLLDLNAGINMGFGDYKMGFGVDAGIAVYTSSFCGVGVSYIHFFKDKLNLISFGPTVRIPLNFNKFYINPYGKAEAGFTTQGENTYIPLKLQGGVEVIFNHEDKFKYGFGLSYANLKFKEFGGFDEVDNFVDKDISVVTIYGKFCL